MICFQISIFELLETTWPPKEAAVKPLWFAFKSVYLNYWKQQIRRGVIGYTRCDLLSNQYIWTTGNNYIFWTLLSWTVVICFQISIFELLETTCELIWCYRKVLWFAFKSVYLNYWKQLSTHATLLSASCDLLSNQYIWTTGNNCSVAVSAFRGLWFAFKSVYLNYWKQHIERSGCSL